MEAEEKVEAGSVKDMLTSSLMALQVFDFGKCPIT